MTFHSCEWPAFVIAGPALSLVCNAELCSALLLTDLSTRPNEVGDRYCSQEEWPVLGTPRRLSDLDA